MDEEKVDIQAVGIRKLHDFFTRAIKKLNLIENYETHLDALPDGIAYRIVKKKVEEPDAEMEDLTLDENTD